MDKRSMVTVICLAYNHEKYIRNTLEGFVSQKTSFNFDVIVHDDCSFDNTRRIINEYAIKYPQLIKPIFESENIYSKKNVSIINDIIIPKITSKYVAFCEGDDYWCDTLKLQKQVDVFERMPNVVMVGHNTNVLDSNNRFIGMMCSQTESGYINPNDIIFKATRRNPHYSSLMVRTEFFVMRTPEFFSLITGDDRLRLSMITHGKVYYLCDVMSVYRQFALGSWNSRIKNDYDYRISLFKKRERFFTAYDSYTNNIFHDACEKEINSCRYKVAVLEGRYKDAFSFRKQVSIPTKTKLFICLFVIVPFFGSVYYRHKRKANNVPN